MLRPFCTTALCAFLATIACSCAGKDAVSVSASLGNASVAVSQPPGGLVSNLSGSFDISLELGKRASGSADVTLSSFSLVGASTEADLLGKPLSFTSSLPSPIHLAPGDSTTAHLTLESASTPGKPIEISTAEASTICSAGQLKIVGTLQDSAGETIQVASPPFSPSGC